MKTSEIIIETIAAKKLTARFEKMEIITIKFDSIPNKKVLYSLKRQGFKYNNNNKIWTNTCTQLSDPTINSIIFKSVIFYENTEINEDKINTSAGFSMKDTAYNRTIVNKFGYDAIEHI